MQATLTLRHIEPVTRDTHRLVFDRPEGFDFKPGQATTLAVQRDGWRGEQRPFTMTSQPEDRRLEFIIKSYPDHDGVTAQIATLKPGEQVAVTDPEGAITDQGPGTFIAGGAGVTPFIAILRRRARKGELRDCHLMFSNQTERDIILRDEWEAMDALETTFVVTDDPESDQPKGPIDRGFLEGRIDTGGRFYLCGPEAMVNDVRDALKSLGVKEDRIVTEAGW